MTVSAQIVGTAREVPDSVSASLPKSGKSIKSDFHSVFEQYHASRGNGSETNRTQGPKQKQKQKQKTSDPTAAPAVTPTATPAAEAPRLIRPFNTSITLRQETTPLGDATDQTPSSDDAATSNSAAPILRGTLDLRNLPSQAAGASLDPTSMAYPSIPILPVASATTLEQGATVLEKSSTVCEASYTASISTLDRTIAYQYRDSSDRPAETGVSGRAIQERQPVSDPAQAVVLPMLVTNALEPQLPIHPLTGSTTPRQDARVQDSGSADPTPPVFERAVDNTAAAPNADALAFAARLTPTAELQPAATESTRPAGALSGSQTPLQLTIPVSAKPIATGADLPADAHSGDGGGPSNREKASDLFAKPETLLPQIHAAVSDQTALPANYHASTSPLTPAARIDHIIDPAAEPTKTGHDITVRIPDATGQDTAVRFVERAGQIHVSVRTGDAEMAQNLRGGLNDLVNHLEDGGIRTEVWQPGPGSNAAFSQNDSQQPFADPDGSNGRQHSSGSNSEQDAKEQNKPRWVEELEGSIGNPNFKETTQIPWQA